MRAREKLAPLLILIISTARPQGQMGLGCFDPSEDLTEVLLRCGAGVDRGAHRSRLLWGLAACRDRWDRYGRHHPFGASIARPIPRYWMAGLDRSDLHICHDADPAVVGVANSSLAVPTAALRWLNLTGLILGLDNLALVVIAGPRSGKGRGGRIRLISGKPRLRGSMKEDRQPRRTSPTIATTAGHGRQKHERTCAP